MKILQKKSLYKWVLLLALPIALQNVITYSVGLTDNLMVSSLGERSISAVFVANQIQNILQMLVIGLGAAVTILAVQYWGKKDTDSVKIIIGIALKLSLGAGLIFLLATLIFPVQILRIFTNEQKVITEGLKYMTIIRFTYIFFCITQVLISSMRCVERVKIGMYISIVTFFVNIFLNWVLIFGHLGAPALGIRGSATATLVARMLETFIMIIYVRFVDDKLRLRFKDLLKSKFTLLKDFLKYGFPVISGDVLWGVNLAVQGGIIGRLGATALASVSISNVIFSMLSVAVYGTAGAAAVIIGKTVGSGDYILVKQYAKKLQVLFLILGVISGIALFIAKDYILLLYHVSGSTIIMTTQFLIVLSVTLVGTSYQMSTLTGIVRAGGSIYFVLINDIIFVWLVVIPSAWIAAFVFHAPPVVVFMCLKSDQILKCGVAVVKVNRFKWMKNLTREHSI
ncbi:MAG TPA: MATE family efflux transporter [Clostridiaceae bacterium]